MSKKTDCNRGTTFIGNTFNGDFVLGKGCVTVIEVTNEPDDIKVKPKFLGEEVVDICTTKYAMYKPHDWVFLYIEMHGQIDGSRHKDWLIDQIARILKGTKVIVKLAKWDDNNLIREKERFDLGYASEEYNNWVKEMCDGEFGADTYSYNVGIAP